MKRFYVAALIMAALVTSCKEPDYKALINKEVNAFSELYNSTIADTSLSESAQEDKIYAAYDKMTETLYGIASKALKKHDNDSLAVEMVGIIAGYELTDNENLIKIIDALGPDAKADDSIVELRNTLEVVLNTGEGKAFVDFEVEQPEGSRRKLSDFAGNGKYCVVDFWASWCGPCKREIPYLKSVWDKYSKKGLNMVSVAVWDSPKASADTAKAYGMTWDMILGADNAPTELYGVTGIPFIMLIGPDGTILKRDLRGDDINDAVAKYL